MKIKIINTHKQYESKSTGKYIIPVGIDKKYHQVIFWLNAPNQIKLIETSLGKFDVKKENRD